MSVNVKMCFDEEIMVLRMLLEGWVQLMTGLTRCKIDVKKYAPNIDKAVTCFYILNDG